MFNSDSQALLCFKQQGGNNFFVVQGFLTIKQQNISVNYNGQERKLSHDI
jgi:hypothetical protein